VANIVPILLNNVSSTVQAGSSAIGSSSATGVNVASGDGANFGTIGTGQYIPAVIVDTSTTPETVKEYVWITARSTDALTVVRQAEESSRYAASTTTIQAGYTIAAVATRVTIVPSMAMPPNGLNQALAWSHDPVQNVGTYQPGSTWTTLVAIYVPRDITVNTITMLTSAGASSPTSGQNWFGLYSTAGTRLGVTSDMSTPLVTAGVVTGTLTSSVALTGGSFVYGAFVCTGSATPFFYRPSTATGAAYIAGTNFNATSGQARAMNGQVGTTLPSSITLSSMSATHGAAWMCLA
jgi:hypothetical protein